LALLKEFFILQEPLLTGFIERRLDFHFHLLLLKNLGEFPLVEGSFKNLTFIGLPSAKFQS